MLRPLDEITVAGSAFAPTGGLVEGIDPALPAPLYEDGWAPELLNVRVGRGQWEPRRGMDLWSTLGGSGNTRGLFSLTLKNGDRYRVAVRGGAVYYRLHTAAGSEGAWTAATGTGATGLADNYVRAVAVGERLYLTDQSGQLRVFKPTLGTVTYVTQPLAPSGVRAFPMTYRVLESWTGLNTNGSGSGTSWSGNDTDFNIRKNTTRKNPLADEYGGVTAELRVTTGATEGDSVTRNVREEEVPSYTLAWYQRATSAKRRVNFEVGQISAGEFPFTIKTEEADEWILRFANIGPVGTINKKRLRLVKVPDAAYTLYLSPLLLPGKLEGEYRWMVTHYDGSDRESEPSAISNSGRPLDLSAKGTTGEDETVGAIKKSAAIYWDSDSGTDSTTTRVRVWRNGGPPELTQDPQGVDRWLLAWEGQDFLSTLNANITAGASSFQVVKSGGYTPVEGDWFVISKGAADLYVNEEEEFVQAMTVADGGTYWTITAQSPFTFLWGHPSGRPVQLCFVDNVSNTELATVTEEVQVERDDPPQAIRWLGLAPDGRLWAFGYSGEPCGVAVSNLPTPERLNDHEVFPDGVNALARGSLTQGFRFTVAGAHPGERIVWGGFFRRVPTIMTTTGTYRAYAYSQADFTPTTVGKDLQLGCLNGQTVVEVSGALYWVDHYRRVVRWDGQGAPQVVSDRRVNRRLEGASSTYWDEWHAEAVQTDTGAYYRLWYVPAGQTQAIEALDFSVERNLWEPVRYYVGGATPLPLVCAHVRQGPGDSKQLYACHPTNGRLYQLETGTRDREDGATYYGVPVSWKTKRFDLGQVHQMKRVLLRGAASTDSYSVTVRMGGSDYGDLSETYTFPFTGTGDQWPKNQTHHTLRGCWAQFEGSCTVSDGCAPREIEWRMVPVRDGRLVD